jgi:hypothetical protein
MMQNNKTIKAKDNESNNNQNSSSEENNQSKPTKRGMLQIIEDVFTFLEDKGEVPQSVLREIVPSPSNRHILEIIQAIQQKPYLQFNSKGRFTTIKLENKSRYDESQVAKMNALYQKIQNRILKLRDMEYNDTVSQIFLLYEYKSSLSEIKRELERVLNTKE